MNEYSYGVDGNHYHISQVTIDEAGRWIPREGAIPGPIARPSEFGELPVIPEPAAGYLAAWRAERDGSKTGTYATKIDVPEARAETPVEVAMTVDDEAMSAALDADADRDPDPDAERHARRARGR